jgi:predicted phage terminase large subunit-like protein
MQFRESNFVASICRQSFYEFLREFWEVIVQEEPQLNWHIKFICDELQTIAERVFLGLPREYDEVINVPPGSTKSTICSQMFPAWVWTKMPSAKFICASYAYPIALKDSIRTRDIVQSEKYKECFSDIQMREDQNTKGLFVNTKGGYRYSCGVNGAVTGVHGHFLLIDDPINPEEAYSQADLKQVNRWMSTTLPPRRINKKVSTTILIQQRLHQSDPSGDMLLKPKVRHVCLPGELTDGISPPELKSFYRDGLLDPDRMPRNVLDELKKELGDYGYSSQILQDPVPLGGGMFKVDKLQYHDAVTRQIVRMVRSWDKAGTKDGGAWSVGVLMGIDTAGEFWVLDVIRGQWGSTEREEQILIAAEKDKEEVRIIIEIEGGSGGKESGENTIRNLAGFHVIPHHPTSDKETRAYPFSSQVGGGNVHILKRHWTKDYVEELRYFPHSRYKDQVDASGSAFNYLARKKKRIGAI